MRPRLLGLHREVHTLITVEKARLAGHGSGYRNHPEAVKYRGRLAELSDVHRQVSEEMRRRGYREQTPVEDAAEPFTYSAEEYSRDLVDLIGRQGGVYHGS